MHITAPQPPEPLLAGRAPAAPVPTRRRVAVAWRWASVAARMLHLVGIAWWFADRTPEAIVLTTLSGTALLAYELYREGTDYLRYIVFWVLVLKLLLLGGALLVPGWRAVAIWAALLLAGLVAHAPGSFRHYALWGPPGPCADPRRKQCG